MESKEVQLRSKSDVDDIIARNDVTLPKLKEDAPQVVAWLEHLVYPYKLHNRVEVSMKPDKLQYHLYIYSDNYRYSISISLPSEERPNGYLGCQVGTRKPRAGESHTRGNDLPDGPLTEDTWNSILRGIVRYELVMLGK